VLALLISCVFSVPSFADTYSITFTADPGSTGGNIAATTTSFTTGPITIDWGNAVFTLSAAELSEMLGDCAPISATPTACASYDASDAGVFQPKINVEPLLDVSDDGGAKSSFTLAASAADSSCLIEGCFSSGVISLADQTPVNAPEPNVSTMLLAGLLGLSLLAGVKRTAGSLGAGGA
jgi:hypothetical protein